ncbi:replication protein [Thiolinea disciformis]|uniref:replication protein n=1 Tax=Thiolinea disciformis TaxID=125614 RepID=UPI00036D974D|nr:replication protein [Thiolinea disciformis]
MSLITLLDKALATDLSKSEHRAFLALLRQTLGFNKVSDALTFNRLAKLMGLRKDHAKKAVQGVVDAGLFQQVPHAEYEFTYSVPMVEPTRVSRPAQEINLPEGLDDETTATLQRSLKTLCPTDAQHVCQLLGKAMQDGSIRTTPLRFASALVKAAKVGALDISALSAQPIAQQPPQAQKKHPDLEARFRDSFFAQVAQLTGQPIELVRAQHGCG